MKERINNWLEVYTLEEILELGELEPVEAIELLVTYGALNVENLEADQNFDLLEDPE